MPTELSEQTANQVAEHLTQLEKRSKLNILTLFVLCVASALLTASIILIYQYKQGIPYNITMSLVIAACFGILIPLIVTRIYLHFRKQVRYGAYAAFLLCNIVLSLGIGISIF